MGFRGTIAKYMVAGTAFVGAIGGVKGAVEGIISPDETMGQGFGRGLVEIYGDVASGVMDVFERPETQEAIRDGTRRSVEIGGGLATSAMNGLADAVEPD